MKLVSLGAVLLALALPLSGTGREWMGSVAAFGFFLVLFGSGAWAVTCRRSTAPTLRHDREVVWSALGLALCSVLILFGGTVALIGFLLWWVAAIAFALTSISRLLAVRRMRRAAAEAALDSA
jgi:hypothetical protein